MNVLHRFWFWFIGRPEEISLPETLRRIWKADVIR
jgi:hypothetical protein